MTNFIRDLFYCREGKNKTYKLFGLPVLRVLRTEVRKEFIFFGILKLSSYKNRYRPYGLCYKLLRHISRIMNRELIEKNKRARILVHLHLYYTNAWCEIKEYLENLSCYSFDLIVTYSEEETDLSFIEKIKKFKNDAKIIPYPNKGFDIAPFILLLNDINLSKYDIIYHVHSKSIASDKGRLAYDKLFKSSSWFKQLYSGVLGVFNVHHGIDILLNDNKYGMIGANNLICQDTPERRELVYEYASRRGIELYKNYSFIIGSCFGIKADLLSSLKNVGFTSDDFYVSKRGIFTLAHALERIICSEVLRQGKLIYPMPVWYNNHNYQTRAKLRKKDKKTNNLIEKIKKVEFEDIKVLNMDLKSGLGCTFLTAQYKDKKVFVKWGGDGEIVQNEAEKQAEFKEILPDYVPDVCCYSIEPPFIATEYIDGYNLEQLMNFGLSDEERNNVLASLEVIKKQLASCPYMHRDIMPSNLIYSNNRLYLIDYQFAVNKNNDGSLQELDYVNSRSDVRHALGGIYKKDFYMWDDVYSLEKIIEEVK